MDLFHGHVFDLFCCDVRAERLKFQESLIFAGRKSQMMGFLCIFVICHVTVSVLIFLGGSFSVGVYASALSGVFSGYCNRQNFISGQQIFDTV